jgi:hypothetical protein
MIQLSALERLKTSLRDLIPPSATAATFVLCSTAYSATITQVQVTDDASSGISSANTFTHAFDFGSTDSDAEAQTYTANGVPFTEVPSTISTSATLTDATTNNTLVAAVANGSTTVKGHPGNGSIVGLTDAVSDIYRDFAYVEAGVSDATLSFTVEGLVAGQTYSARFYGYGWEAATTDRRVTLSTDVDSTTGTFNWNEYGLNSPFYLNATYTAAGTSATFTMTLLDGENGPHMAAFTNH